MAIEWGAEIIRVIAATLLSGMGVGGYVKYRYSKKLNEESERLKHDLRKEAFNAEMIITERHKIYSELTECIKKAEGLVFDYYDVNFDISYAMSYEEFNENDFQRLFDEFEVMDGLRSDFFELYKCDSGKAINLWRSKRPNLLGNLARRAIDDAKNFYLIKKIYLTDLVDEKALSAIQNLGSFLGKSRSCVEKNRQLEARGRTLDDSDYDKLNLLKDEAKKCIEDLINNMKLSISEPAAHATTVE